MFFHYALLQCCMKVGSSAARGMLDQRGSRKPNPFIRSNINSFGGKQNRSTRSTTSGPFATLERVINFWGLDQRKRRKLPWLLNGINSSPFQNFHLLPQPPPTPPHHPAHRSPTLWAGQFPTCCSWPTLDKTLTASTWGDRYSTGGLYF